MKGRINITVKTTTRDVLTLLTDVDFLDRLEAGIKPVELEEITYGQRLELSGMKTVRDMILMPWKVLKDTPEEKVLRMSFFQVFAFSYSVVREIKRMAERDERTFTYTPTPEEVQAGYLSLNHGAFGTVDRIAQRLNISHEAVFELPEKRVYAMLKIDYDTSNYQRKLNNIITKKQ